MRKLLQINPVLRVNTSTGRIMQEIGELAMQNGWESYIAYSKGRDGIKPCASELVPVGNIGSVAWHGVETRLLDRHGLASAGATRRLVRKIDEIAPDVIHIHNIHGYFLNYRILFDYLSQCDIPVVWTVHDCWLYTGHCYYYSSVNCNRWQTGCHHCPQKRQFPASLLRDRSRKNYEDKRKAFTSMPKDRLMIVPVSEWIKSEMQQSFWKGYDFRVIHNGIDTGLFHPCATEEIRSRYQLGSKHIWLGVASIWSKEKGLDDFVELAEMLADDEVIVLVGLKPEDRKRLPRQIVGIARTENIQQLAELYSAADVLLNPTWQDNYPTVNLEAIACGTPVVTYRTGGSVEAIADGTGLVVDQGDVKGLRDAARAVRKIDRRVWQQQCRDYALKYFGKKERYADYFLLYDELIRRTKGKVR